MLSANSATVSMGGPVTVPVLIPVEHKSTPACISNPFMINGECHRVTAMSFGTPHGAVLVDDVDSVDVSSLGLALGTHALFPKGASIVFIQAINGKKVKARLWQRGEGEIEFSPEAASVAGVAAMMLQKVLRSETFVTMGEHTVHVSWDRGVGNVSLTGPADLVQA